MSADTNRDKLAHQTKHITSKSI